MLKTFCYDIDLLSCVVELFFGVNYWDAGI